MMPALMAKDRRLVTVGLVLAVVASALVFGVYRSRFDLDTDSEIEESDRDRLSPPEGEEEEEEREREAQARGAQIVPPIITTPQGAESVEQTAPGSRPGAEIVASFDGLGVGFEGPQGTAVLRNPSDNSLAVGLHHVVQIVNSRVAIFTKEGKALYGPVATNTVFKNFGGACEATNSGDAVVRYDQIADRWLFVMPVFRRGNVRPDQPAPGRSGEPAKVSLPGRPDQPGPAMKLDVPPPPPPAPATPPAPRGQGAAGGPRAAAPLGPYSMCYAISTSSDPMGSYYRYEFLRPLFPDYPRPAIWSDGYYVPTSTGDDVIQKHAC